MSQAPILVGVIGRPHGVRGHLHVHSYTSAPRDLAAYGLLETPDGRNFTLNWLSGDVAELREIVSGTIRIVADRATAEQLVNTQLFVNRANLPKADEEEFYFADLIGMQAETADGTRVGMVTVVHDYGAGASLEIATDRAPLILPFTRACVPVVDIAARRLTISPPDEVLVPDGSPNIALTSAMTMAGIG